MRRQLEKQQNEVMDVLDRLDHLLDQCGPENIVALGETRLGFNEMLQQHFLFKEKVYSEIRARGGEDVDRTVGRSRSQMMALVVAYRFHAADWTPQAMLANWPGYIAASRALITRVRSAIRSDRETIYPLLDMQTTPSDMLRFGPDEAAIIGVHRALGQVVSATME